MASIDFYFDFVSPYAYFAWARVSRFATSRDLDLHLKPVLLAALLNHWGQKGATEVPPKRAFVLRDCMRYAGREGLAFEVPPTYPFNPLSALRVALPEVAGREQSAVIDALFGAAWGRGEAIDTPTAVADVLDRAGLDGQGLVDRTRATSVKERLKAQTDHAMEKGVFEVPTMIVGEELFWGHGQFDAIERFLEGDRGYDPARIEPLLGREASAAERARRSL